MSKPADLSKKEIAANSPPNRGFFPRLSQPGDTLAFEMVRARAVDFDDLDRTLNQVFGTEFISCKKAGVRGAKKDIQLAWRVFLVGRDLLQAAGIPAFDPGILIALGDSSGNAGAMRVRGLYPFVENVPSKYIGMAYRYACQIVRLLVERPLRPSVFEELLQQVHNQLVKPARNDLSCGESTVPVLKQAYERGIPFRHLGASVYRLGWGARSRLMNRSAVESDSAIGARMSQDKRMTAMVLRGAGLPASTHLLVSSAEDALKAAETIGWPVVLKPVDRDRGEGVSVGIADASALDQAFQKAVAYSPSVLVEQQVAGICHRLFVAGGRKIQFVSRRLPKSVLGDGARTVAELVDEANKKEQVKAPWLRLKPFPVDELAINCLADAGLALDSIPGEGRYAPLRRIQSDADGGVAEDLTEGVHPENVDIALRAAALFGLDSAGIDLISEDISRPWYENGAVINEVNFASLVGGFRARVGNQRYLGEFLDLFFHGSGRLPMEVFVGGEKAMAAAQAHQRQRVADGLQCYLTSQSLTLRPAGTIAAFAEHSLFNRVLHLMAVRDMEALILVVQTDELLHTGLPVDGVGPVHPVDTQLVDWKDPRRKLPPPVCQRLSTFLGEFSKPVKPVTGESGE